MSATVTWKPDNPESGEWAGKGALKEALESCFGHLPLTLDALQVPVLKGIMHGGTADAQNLIDAIEQVGAIRVEVNY